jgi:4-aminobutyrate aminotransferase/4-aminobutyrate aminotransferase/(S)-3-amino-2-methylpropionate transaminase
VDVLSHGNVLPDIVTFGKSFGNGFPVTAMVVSEENAGPERSPLLQLRRNPMAFAPRPGLPGHRGEGAAGERASGGRLLPEAPAGHEAGPPIVGDVKGKGFLLGIELVKDKAGKEPFEEAGKLVYQKAFRKGLAWIPAGHILRMSPPLIMDEKYAEMGLSMIEESIAEVEKQFGYR